MGICSGSRPSSLRRLWSASDRLNSIKGRAEDIGLRHEVLISGDAGTQEFQSTVSRIWNSGRVGAKSDFSTFLLKLKKWNFRPSLGLFEALGRSGRSQMTLVRPGGRYLRFGPNQNVQSDIRCWHSHHVGIDLEKPTWCESIFEIFDTKIWNSVPVLSGWALGVGGQREEAFFSIIPQRCRARTAHAMIL